MIIIFVESFITIFLKTCWGTYKYAQLMAFDEFETFERLVDTSLSSSWSLRDEPSKDNNKRKVLKNSFKNLFRYVH